MTEAPPDPAAIASAEEAAALQDKLTTALALLKRARGTAGYLYEQPWYVIIGPPGAGKTTALLNAGLRFPLAAEMGQGAVAGVGGTRLCDWWFTEDAVLIDTAGRYTTQDSDAAVDRAGWEAFLDLLKRTRSRQPLNGVIVAIALTEIGAATREERLAHARAVRRRIKELEERLAVRLPVYAVFTKADLVAGFTEFFDDLDREKRAQVWGATLPLAQAEAGTVGGFVAEFRALIERLNSRLFDRLQAERSPDRRALIAGFPAQVASLEAPLAEFLQEAFGGSRLDPAPMLRGFYFTSGTQEGTPFDRLTGVLARSFGIDQRRAPTLRPEEGRSYFLARLVKEVIFGEAMLVSEKPGACRPPHAVAERRLCACRLSPCSWPAACCGTPTARIASRSTRWTPRSPATRRPRLGCRSTRWRTLTCPAFCRCSTRRERCRTAMSAARTTRLSLAPLRPVAGGQAGCRRTAGIPPCARMGAAAASDLAARSADARRDRPAGLSLRSDARLSDARRQPARSIAIWFAPGWRSIGRPRYPGAVMAPMRDGLARHLDALLTDPLPHDPARRRAVGHRRARPSAAFPLASSRLFAHRFLRRRASGSALAAGRCAGRGRCPRLCARLRQTADRRRPGFYTVDGFYKVLLPALGDATKQVASESWVLGRRSEIAPDSLEAQRLEHDVIALYEADYAKHWDAMLADLNLVPLRTPEQADQDLYMLGSPQSPIRDLLASIARQLTLSQPPPAPPGEAAAKSPPRAARKNSHPMPQQRLKPVAR